MSTNAMLILTIVMTTLIVRTPLEASSVHVVLVTLVMVWTTVLVIIKCSLGIGSCGSSSHTPSTSTSDC